MAQQQPNGLINAVTTPFGRDGSIDEDSFTNHIQWLSKNGIRHLLVAGTTGEFFSLRMAEKKRLLVLAVDHFGGGVMFHAGAGSLPDTLELVRFGCEHGAHSIAAILPYYLASVPRDGLVAYLKKVSQACSVPFLIYNFPAHTQVAIDEDILASVPHFGIKDSSANLSFITHTDNYFIGSDTQLIRSHEAGGKGFISARANAEPALYAAIDDALRAGDTDHANRLHKEVLRVCRELGGPSQIRLVKERIATHLPEYPTGVRPPLL